MSEWIRIEDKAPVKGSLVFGWSFREGFYVCEVWKCPEVSNYPFDMRGKTFLNKRSSGCGCCDATMEGDVYWISLPEPPSEFDDMLKEMNENMAHKVCEAIKKD